MLVHPHAPADGAHMAHVDLKKRGKKNTEAQWQWGKNGHPILVGWSEPFPKPLGNLERHQVNINEPSPRLKREWGRPSSMFSSPAKVRIQFLADASCSGGGKLSMWGLASFWFLFEAPSTKTHPHSPDNGASWMKHPLKSKITWCFVDMQVRTEMQTMH